MHVSVATGGQPYAPPDLLVGFVGEVCERHPKRPVRRFEAAAIQENDSVSLGEAEGEVERMDVLLQVIDRTVADILPRPELEVDQGIIGVEICIWRDFEAHGLDQGMDAPVDDLLAGLLVV